MGFLDSLQTIVDRVAGTSASISLAMESPYAVPGQTVSINVSVKNGNAPLAVRAVVVEVQAIEEINIPRNADWGNALEDLAEVLEEAVESKSASKTQSSSAIEPTRRTKEATRHSELTVNLLYPVASALTLSPGEVREYKAPVRLPDRAQPTYTGKYATHCWQVRARLDVFGTDPNTGWVSFRMGTNA